MPPSVAQHFPPLIAISPPEQLPPTGSSFHVGLGKPAWHVSSDQVSALLQACHRSVNACGLACSAQIEPFAVCCYRCPAPTAIPSSVASHVKLCKLITCDVVIVRRVFQVNRDGAAVVGDGNWCRQCRSRISDTLAVHLGADILDGLGACRSRWECPLFNKR
jgi:hypothetical protein